MISPFLVAVDGIMLEKNKKTVLLIERLNEPYKNYWALPGGMVDENETVEAALIREMKEETNLDVVPHSILGVYSDPQRDPRGRNIGIVFICEWCGTPKAGDDAKNLKFSPLISLSELKLAFDHKKILIDLLMWLQDPHLTFWSNK